MDLQARRRAPAQRRGTARGVGRRRTPDARADDPAPSVLPSRGHLRALPHEPGRQARRRPHDERLVTERASQREVALEQGHVRRVARDLRPERHAGRRSRGAEHPVRQREEQPGVPDVRGDPATEPEQTDLVAIGPFPDRPRVIEQHPQGAPEQGDARGVPVCRLRREPGEQHVGGTSGLTERRRARTLRASSSQVSPALLAPTVEAATKASRYVSQATSRSWDWKRWAACMS